MHAHSGILLSPHSSHHADLRGVRYGADDCSMPFTNCRRRITAASLPTGLERSNDVSSPKLRRRAWLCSGALRQERNIKDSNKRRNRYTSHRSLSQPHITAPINFDLSQSVRYPLRTHSSHALIRQPALLPPINPSLSSLAPIINHIYQQI
jgi:hypothetical protein